MLCLSSRCVDVCVCVCVCMVANWSPKKVPKMVESIRFARRNLNDFLKCYIYIYIYTQELPRPSRGAGGCRRRRICVADCIFFLFRSCVAMSVDLVFDKSSGITRCLAGGYGCLSVWPWHFHRMAFNPGLSKSLGITVICSMLAWDCARRRCQKKDYLNLSEGPIQQDGLCQIMQETSNERLCNIARGKIQTPDYLKWRKESNQQKDQTNVCQNNISFDHEIFIEWPLSQTSQNPRAPERFVLCWPCGWHQFWYVELPRKPIEFLELQLSTQSSSERPSDQSGWIRMWGITQTGTVLTECPTATACGHNLDGKSKFVILHHATCSPHEHIW